MYQKTSKEAIVGRARLWIPISVLCQLNKTIILFDSNFVYTEIKLKLIFRSPLKFVMKSTYILNVLNF